MRLGIFGGTFDPVHFGHLLLAECCREACRLDEVWFVPTCIPPHKQERVLTDGKRRVEMLQLAIAGNAAFRVSTLELDRGGISYTVETLRQIHSQLPQAELYLLLGADMLADLPAWREPETICRLARLAVVQRVGQAIPWTALEPLLGPQPFRHDRLSLVEMPLIELSSSQIRAAVAGGRSIRYRTPRSVELYILEHKLYKSLPEHPSPPDLTAST